MHTTRRAVEQDDMVLRFHDRYYGSRVWMDTYWRGVPTQKCPLDLWVYQEIIWSTRPDLIVETGTAAGGSALYLASICDLQGHGRVITIDIEDRPDKPRHRRIEYVSGRSSVDPAVVAHVRRRASGGQVMVILDADHSRDHVLAELRAYAPMVTAAQYLIVEDTNINGHPVLPEFGPGPMEAVQAFMAENGDFEPDDQREKFMLTFNPGAYLRRVSNGEGSQGRQIGMR
jgi:cephalosporin hydroxylase